MQRPHSTEEKAWKAYVKDSQTAVSTHLSSGLMQLLLA